jgi:hypothetical protein
MIHNRLQFQKPNFLAFDKRNVSVEYTSNMIHRIRPLASDWAAKLV